MTTCSNADPGSTICGLCAGMGYRNCRFGEAARPSPRYAISDKEMSDLRIAAKVVRQQCVDNEVTQRIIATLERLSGAVPDAIQRSDGKSYEGRMWRGPERGYTEWTPISPVDYDALRKEPPWEFREAPFGVPARVTSPSGERNADVGMGSAEGGKP